MIRGKPTECASIKGVAAGGDRGWSARDHARVRDALQGTGAGRAAPKIVIEA